MVTAIVIDKAWQALKPQMAVALASLKEVFQTVADTVAPDAAFVARTKERASAARKLTEKPQYTRYAELGDLVKGAVLCQSVAQVKEVCAFLLATTTVIKLEVKTGTDELPYRGIIHLDIALNGLACEIQICTEATWEVRKQTYKLYKTGRAAEAKTLWDSVEQIVF